MDEPAKSDQKTNTAALATAGAMVFIFGYFWSGNSHQLVEILWPVYVAGFVGVLWGLRGKPLLAVLGSIGVFAAMNFGAFLHDPNSFSAGANADYDALFWYVTAIQIAICLISSSPGFVVGLFRMRRRIPIPGVCNRCGCNLRGNQGGRCSECGLVKEGGTRASERS